MEIIDFLFSTAYWPPRWYCGHWTEALGWTHILSDIAIFGAYLAIPIILLYFCWKRKNLPFQKILILFGLFIVFCGTGHLVESMIFWFPVYRFDALIKVCTALVSWLTVFALVPYIPRVLKFPKLEELNEMLTSDLVQSREQLIQSNAHLEAEIARRKVVENKLEQVIENLQNANKELEQFTKVASHDLQEPLRTISSFVKLLERKCSGRLDEETKAYMGFIVSAATRMRHLIDDLLEFARVGQDLSMEDVDCNEILEEVLTDLSLSIRENKIKITTSILPKVIGKRIRLKRLFQNLIMNSIKFRRTDVQTEIEVFVEEKETEYIFTVKDNGIGIESQYLPKLFTIFQRLHPSDEFPGTGIGLAICKKIVFLHHGTIWVESQIGEGSAFHFSIPKKTFNYLLQDH